jgi:hypothetical protein
MHSSAQQQGLRRAAEARRAPRAQVRDMTGTGEVTKRRVREGRGEFPADCPMEDCAVRVHLRALRPGTGQVPARPAALRAPTPPMRHGRLLAHTLRLLRTATCHNP